MDEGLIDLESTLETWIGRCRAVVQQANRPPYLGEALRELEDAPGLKLSSPPWASLKKRRQRLEAFVRAMESRFAASPGDSAVRLAALYPLKGTRYGLHFEAEFRYLAGLCVPERLTSLADLKFELHVSYLTASWDKAEEIFQRIALLGALKPEALFALRGHFWFVSVFGRQIEFELQQEDVPGCDYFYGWTHPLGVERWRQSDFCLPESGWLWAEEQVHGDCPVPELYPHNLNAAVREFGWVLEHELKVRVFDEFREWVRSNASNQLRNDYFEVPQDSFLRLLWKKPEIGLGSMIAAIRDCSNSAIQTDKAFLRWLEDWFPSLRAATATMEYVNLHRNRATHEMPSSRFGRYSTLRPARGPAGLASRPESAYQLTLSQTPCPYARQAESSCMAVSLQMHRLERSKA